jgi:hypothetical protein
MGRTGIDLSRRLGGLLVSLVASAAAACPVCGQVYPRAQGAMLVMTIIMSVLPLAMIFGILGWVVLRIRREASPPPAQAPAASERSVPGTSLQGAADPVRS